MVLACLVQLRQRRSWWCRQGRGLRSARVGCPSVRALVEEGLVESVPKRGFYVRRPSAMAWHMTHGGTRRAGQVLLDGWELDVLTAGLEPVAEVSVAIEDAGVLVAGRSAGERRLLALPQVSVVLELARTAESADGKPVVVLHQIQRGDGATYSYHITYPGR
jgi:DNA-binding GntR family transcriptional regulator